MTPKEALQCLDEVIKVLDNPVLSDDTVEDAYNAVDMLRNYFNELDALTAHTSEEKEIIQHICKAFSVPAEFFKM